MFKRDPQRDLTAYIDDRLSGRRRSRIEDDHIERNPARNKRMRVRVPKPQRSFLELDELRALMDAAAAQDPVTGHVKPPPGVGETARKVSEMLTRGMNQADIAEALGRTKATINWHAQRMSVVGPPYVGRAWVVRPGEGPCGRWPCGRRAESSSGVGSGA